MTNYQKEDIERIQIEIAKLLVERYPGLPFVTIFQTNDGAHFVRASSEFLQDPIICIKLLSNVIDHAAMSIINNNIQMMQQMQQVQLHNVMNEAKTATKN